jgi:hypothetical protein
VILILSGICYPSASLLNLVALINNSIVFNCISLLATSIICYTLNRVHTILSKGHKAGKGSHWSTLSLDSSIGNLALIPNTKKGKSVAYS